MTPPNPEYVTRLIWDDGRRLREVREKRGLSRPQLARRLGVRADTVKGYETGKWGPGAGRLADLAFYLGVKVDELYVEIKVPKPRKLS